LIRVAAKCCLSWNFCSLAPLAPHALPTAHRLDAGADTAVVVATNIAVLHGLSEAVVPPVLPSSASKSRLGNSDHSRRGSRC
jgi:hypothetical protein